jgi:membrane protease YdiL (CAAX protease family)
MDPLTITEISRSVVDGMILAILFGAVASWAWTLRRLLRGEAVLPEAPMVERRTPPWGLGTIALMLAAYVIASHNAFTIYARATRPGRPDRPAEAPAPAEPKKSEGPVPAGADADRGRQAPGVADPDPARGPGGQRPPRPDDDPSESPQGLSPLELMAIQGAINGAFILLLPGLARLTSGARLRDFGLSWRGWWREAAVGIVAVLFLMPIVYVIQAACLTFLGMPDHEREKFKHPLEKMLREDFTPGIASMAFLTAVILAPAFEELFFRGLIQSWLIKAFDRLALRIRSSATSPSPSDSSPGETFQPDTRAMDPLADPDLDGYPAGPPPVVGNGEAENAPPIAAREDGIRIDPPGIYGKTTRPRSTSRAGAAIVLTSLIFAALHAAQWPAPIPLFVLALGLGVVYQRTGSLLAPICMHALFNGFSTLMLFHVALDRPGPEKPEARPVLERLAPAEKAGAVAPDVGPAPHRGKT